MKSKKTLGITLAVILAIGQSSMAWADDAQVMDLVRNMQNQMMELQKTIDRQNQKISQLERGTKGSVSIAPASVAAEPIPMSDYEFNQRLESSLGGANKWLKDLKFAGDLRLRYESFHNRSGNPSEDDDRNRFRYRLRFGFEKKMSEEINVGFGLASGEAAAADGRNQDPTSTNTTLDNNFNFKPIFIETAWASYAPNWAKVGPIDNFSVTAGKIKNPFEQGSSDMIWDRDVRPEGVAERADIRIFKTDNVEMRSYAQAGQFILDEDGSGDDAELWAQQGGLNTVFYLPGMDRPIDHLFAVSFYNFSDYATQSNFSTVGNLTRGNSNVVGPASTLDAENFKVFELYNEIAVFPMGLPTRFFFDWATNTDNSLGDNDSSGIGNAEDNAWAVGVKFGGIAKKGDWELGYAYKRIDANAVPGFNDSDFGYSGHSGKRGSVFKGAYALTNNLSLNSALFFVNNLNSGTGGVLDQEQFRAQVDLLWKF